jgi:hypothetical protein
MTWTNGEKVHADGDREVGLSQQGHDLIHRLRGESQVITHNQCHGVVSGTLSTSDRPSSERLHKNRLQSYVAIGESSLDFFDGPSVTYNSGS